MVGYSLHSNFEEIHAFVKSIKPGKITTQWKTQSKKLPVEKISQKQLNHFEFLKSFQQSGLSKLVDAYTDPSKLSDEYIFLNNVENLMSVKKNLGLSILEEKRMLASKKSFEENESHIYNYKDK